MGGFGTNFGTNFAGILLAQPTIPSTKTVSADLCVTTSVKEDLCV